MRECVAVIIKDNDKYLVGKRTDTGNWASVGGHMENGETPKQAIIRECQEEFNTTILPKEIGVIESDSNGNKVHLFYATDYSTEPRADKKEMSKVIWVTREELDHMNLYPPFKQFLELEKEWINNDKNDILVEDYNPATDRQNYKWDPKLKKTVYIKKADRIQAKRNREREYKQKKLSKNKIKKLIINNKTFHFVKRAVEGNITDKEIVKTIKKPEFKTQIRKDELGRLSYKLFNGNIMIAVNPKTNYLITVKRVTEKRIRQYIRNNNKGVKNGIK